MELSPDCKNTSDGSMCGFCSKCGREFEYKSPNPNEPISAENNNHLYIIKASINDPEHIKEKAKNQEKA